jgi:hypothetical protein
MTDLTNHNPFFHSLTPFHPSNQVAPILCNLAAEQFVTEYVALWGDVHGLAKKTTIDAKIEYLGLVKAHDIRQAARNRGEQVPVTPRTSEYLHESQTTYLSKNQYEILKVLRIYASRAAHTDTKGTLGPFDIAFCIHAIRQLLENPHGSNGSRF